MLATPLRRTTFLTVAVTGVLAALVWGVGATLAPDRLVRRLPLPGSAWEVQFSPDDRLLAATCLDRSTSIREPGRAICWDRRTWRTVRQIPAAMYLGGFTQDGSHLLIRHFGSHATLWDTQSWKPVTSISMAGGPVYFVRDGSSAMLSPDGTRFAVVEQVSNETPTKHAIRLRDLRNGNLLATTYPLDLAFLYLGGFSPDARWLAYDEYRNGICVVDTTSSPRRRHLRVWSLVFASKGKIAVGLVNGEMTVQDAYSLAPIRTFPLSSIFTNGPKQLAVSGDGRLAVVGAMQEAVVYDTATGWELARFPGDFSRRSPALSAQGDALALPLANEVQVWEIGSRDRLMARALFRRLTKRR